MKTSYRSVRTVFASFALTSILAGPASAVVITSFNSQTGFTVSNTDLINGLAPSAISGTTDREGLLTDTTGVALTNGAFGPAGLVSPPNSETTIINDGASVTYTLPSSPLGYFINEIDSYSAWRDTGRVNQDYNILYTTTTNPVFAALTSVHQTYAGGNPSDLAVLVKEVGLANVTALRFDFPSVQLGYVGFREFDVFGVAVPEPSSFILCALGAIGLFVIARRRRKA